MHHNPPSLFFAELALLKDGWAQNVLLTISDGIITAITENTNPQDATRLNGPTIPTIANVHSHAFQRIMAGAAEVSLNPQDSFWSWRDLMYRVSNQLSPEDLKTIATHLYIDMLKAGYTQVGEFHYLHHHIGGQPYANPAEMATQLITAANNTGIGLSLLPALYTYAGFNNQPTTPEQCRFINSTEAYLNLFHKCQSAIADHSRHNIGLCFHSLRATNKQQIEEVLHSTSHTGPIHIHIAEQQKEVNDCLAWSGQRPVQWLSNEIGLDQRWCLVHATHLSTQEIEMISTNNATVGLCPTTEANLGDGIFPAVAFEKAGGRWGIGSDSHVSINLTEELKMLEYSQRLATQKRNRLYSSTETHVGTHLFNQALAGGNQATQVALGLSVGNRADFMVLDNDNPFIAGSNPVQLLNRWIFASSQNAIRHVYAGGKQVIKDFHHELETQSNQAFLAVMHRIMS